MERSVVLAIGAAGAFQRAGLDFPLPSRWEDDYREWSEDNAVREALGVSSDRAAERALDRMIRDARLGDAVELVFRRRIAEIALGVREDDSTLARLYRFVYSKARGSLPSYIRAYFDKWERNMRRYVREVGEALGTDDPDPRDVLAAIDAEIDAAVARAGYGERTAVSSDLSFEAVTVGGTANVGVDLGTLSAMGAMGPFVAGGIAAGSATGSASTAVQAADRKVNTALIVGGIAALALLVYAVRR
jgi:hypothetical protein